MRQFYTVSGTIIALLLMASPGQAHSNQAAPVCLIEASRKVRDNAELADMFGDDQDVRRRLIEQVSGGDVNLSGPLVKEMIEGDRIRQARLLELREEGLLKTAGDYYRAAFIMQHSGESHGYLLAHHFALLSIQLGCERAGWIAAATLDRYLQSIGRSQIYGTQRAGLDAAEPFERDTVTDLERVILGVPSGATDAD